MEYKAFMKLAIGLCINQKKDYEDWLKRLSQFTENIYTFLEINKEGLEKGYTQPKLVTRGVISQIDAIINSDIESNPYLKVFLQADENILAPMEKEEIDLERQPNEENRWEHKPQAYPYIEVMI